MSLRARRIEARQRLYALRVAARAKVEAVPAVQAARRRRQRRRRLIAAVVVVLLLLLVRCECGSAQPPPPVARVVESVDAGVTKAVVGKRRPSVERLKASARPAYDTGTQRSPAWLDDFRMQVAARSPRLASCFQGEERAAALRWTVALNPESGAVSDHVFDAMGSADVSLAQRACVEKALSNPGYRIAEVDRGSVPGRVSLVIEF
jgi:hypothetical protein